MEAPQFRDRITDFGDLIPSVRHAHQRARNLASTLVGREPVAFWSVGPDEARAVECGHCARDRIAIVWRAGRVPAAAVG